MTSKTKPYAKKGTQTWQSKFYGEEDQTWFRQGLNILNQPKLTWRVISKSSKWIKIGLVASLVIFLSSFGLIGYGSYLSLTKEVPANGGDIWEGFIDAQVRQFNPVLASNSSFEERVTSLIYHPLYTVTYPDMVADSSAPKIQPILLDKAPEWVSVNGENTFNTLQFRLRSNVKWSNDKPITTEDVQYTFDRIKEEGGNPVFNKLFQSLEFKNLNAFEFQIVSKEANPDLIYQLNFSPISKVFFGEQANIGLLTDSRSVFSNVTSGYFTIQDAVRDPLPANDTVEAKNAIRPNPIRNTKSGKYEVLVLNRNSVTNYEKVNVDRYILANFDALKEEKGNNFTLEGVVKKQNIHLLNRTGESVISKDSSKDVQSLLSSNQSFVPTNQVYSLFLNMRPRADGYFINPNLRKYVVCHLSNFALKEAWKNSFNSIPLNKKLGPIQLGDTENTCPPTVEEINNMLTQTTDDFGRQIYSIKQDDTRNQKQVLVYGFDISLNLLTTIPSTSPVVSEIRKYLLDIGLPTEEPITEEERVAANLNTDSKIFHLALLHYDLERDSVYSLLGENGYNLGQIQKNNRDPVPSYQFEENLKKWLVSGYSNAESLAKTKSFFANEYAMVNLMQTKEEINYTSPKGFIEFKPSLFTPTSVSQNIPKWYFVTKRE